ncbi:MAG: hypothetical protein ACRDL2_11755 [Gaiellaceae bacterium]
MTTPQQRDRNLGRVRGITATIAGASLAACGLFAGLAASATKRAAPATTTTTTTTKTTVAKKATTTTSSSLSAPTPAPMQTPQAPIASSGGS